MRHTMNRNSDAGFTIVELIIVIGIIAVLLGLTFPAVRTFRMEAYNVNCQSNLRQIGAVLESYKSQNSGMLPIVDFLPAVTNEGPVGGLPWAMRGFLKRDNECWCCPADHDSAESLSTGTSYFYMPGLLRYTPTVQMQVQQAMIPHYLDPTITIKQLERLREGMESRVLTAFYRQEGHRMPVLSDSVDRHPGTRVPRNALFFDGSVGISTDFEDVLEGADGRDDGDFDDDPDEG
jgi:prepilin-type N-terminal cleavage/methylation domain-containing protein/prepilin-type processing-associated H-X9-DG protein